MSTLWVMLGALACVALAALCFLIPWGLVMLVRYAWTRPPWYWHEIQQRYSNGATRVRRMYPPEAKP